MWKRVTGDKDKITHYRWEHWEWIIPVRHTLMLIVWMTVALNSKAGPYYKCPTDAPPPGGEVGRNWRDLELAEPFINNNNTNNQWSEGFPVSSIKNRHQSINCPQPIPIDWLYRLTNNCFHMIQCYLTVLNGTQKKTRSSLQFTWSLLTTSSSLFGISGNSSLGMHSGLAADCI